MGTSRKRTLSRGMSEDESIRHIIMEAEETTKRLTRSDSRYGSLKKGERGLCQSEEDSLAGIPDMMELQANYDSVLQELRDLELQRETLLFQVDCLQDALESAEEMLAEAQREAEDSSMELERERETRRKLEDRVISLIQEVEQLKEERNSIPAVPIYTQVRDNQLEPSTREIFDPQSTAPQPQPQAEHVTPGAEFSLVRLDSSPVAPVGSTENEQVDGTNRGLMSLLQGLSKGEQPEAGHMGTSVDGDPTECGGALENEKENDTSPFTKFTRMVKNFGHTPSLDLSEQPAQEGVFRGSGKEGGDDVDDNDESSGYEDAQSDLQGQETPLGASTPDRSPDAGFLEGDTMADDNEEDTLTIAGESGSPKPNDSCVLS